MGFTDRLHTLDSYQQRKRRLSFLVAVVKKFQEDQASSLAALMAYYGFVSLFPLLLAFVTVLGFVIQGDPNERQKILTGTLGQFPVISDQLKLHSLSGSGLGLVVGVVGSLLAGMGITNSAQNAFDRIWNVPFKHRPNFFKRRLRGLGLFIVLGVLNIVSTVAVGFVSASTAGAPALVAGIVVAFVANMILFTAAFRLLTAVNVSGRELMPGVVVAAVLWQLLQHLGGFYADKAAHDSELYGTFAIVLGLLAWLYLGAQLTILAAEINVVRVRRLWPRSFFSPLTSADRRALISSAETEGRVHEQNIAVTFDEGVAAPPGHTRDP